MSGQLQQSVFGGSTYSSCHGQALVHGAIEDSRETPRGLARPSLPSQPCSALPRKSGATFPCQGLAEALPGCCPRSGWSLAEGSPQMPSCWRWLLAPDSQQTPPPSSPPASSCEPGLCGGPVASGQLPRPRARPWSSWGPAWLPGAAAPCKRQRCEGLGGRGA